MLKGKKRDSDRQKNLTDQEIKFAQIIDVRNLKLNVPYDFENEINNIPGVVANGIFAARKADCLIIDKKGIPEILEK